MGGERGEGGGKLSHLGEKLPDLVIGVYKAH